MNCIRFLGNGLSLLKNTNASACPLIRTVNFSSLLGSQSGNNKTVDRLSSKPLFKTNLNLISSCYELVPKCGLKIYGKPKLRCKHCYYAGIEGVLHVFCSKYPRHKQRALTPGKKKYSWILTHACQSKYRPY